MKRIDNPPNPFESTYTEWLGPAPAATLQVFEDVSRTILAENDSPDLPFRWSLNPYRGCAHACAYCYARPSHAYLGFGAGTDFETKLTVKRQAPTLLRRTFLKRSWRGEPILFSGNTDCYQPLEAVYQLTQQCLAVCLEFRNPLSIITKSYLIVRDVELLQALHRDTHLAVYFSIPFLGDEVARLIEPQTPPPAKRFAALERLSRAGITTGISLAPIIPGLNDADAPRLLKQAKDCGARYATYALIRLPKEVQPVFLKRLEQAMPLRAARVRNKIRETRGGKLYTSTFGQRHTGTGVYWEGIAQLCNTWIEKLGFNIEEVVERRPTFRRPTAQPEFSWA